MQYMKDEHLTLRVPAELARALARWARARGVAKSHVAREAVAAYLDPPPAASVRTVAAAELAVRWAAMPRLLPDEALALADDLAAARAALPGLPEPWA